MERSHRRNRDSGHDLQGASPKPHEHKKILKSHTKKVAASAEYMRAGPNKNRKVVEASTVASLDSHQDKNSSISWTSCKLLSSSKLQRSCGDFALVADGIITVSRHVDDSIFDVKFSRAIYECSNLLTKEHVTSAYKTVQNITRDIEMLPKCERKIHMKRLHESAAVIETQQRHELLSKAQDLFSIDEGWVEASNRHGIRTCYRKVPPGEGNFDPAMKMVRVSGIMEGGLDRIIILLTDIANHHLWLPHTKTAKCVHKFPDSPFHAIVSYETAVPIIHNRELVCERWMNVDIENGLVETLFKSVPTNRNDAPSHWSPELAEDICKTPSKQLVRAHCPYGGFFAEAVDETHTKIVAVSLADIKLPPVAPSWLVNYLARQLAAQTLVTLEHAATMEGKYKVFQESYHCETNQELLNTVKAMIRKKTVV